MVKPGPKEQRLRELREEMVRRSEHNKRLLGGRIKMKAIGRVTSIKVAKRER